MGLLFNILTLPVSGPLRATAWIASQVLEMAEREFYDEGAIRDQIEDVEMRHRLGELTDVQHEAELDSLLERLLAARAYQELHERSP